MTEMNGWLQKCLGSVHIGLSQVAIADASAIS